MVCHVSCKVVQVSVRGPRPQNGDIGKGRLPTTLPDECLGHRVGPTARRTPRDLGIDDAPKRSLLAYPTYLGHAQLAHATPDTAPHGQALRDYIDTTTAVLTA